VRIALPNGGHREKILAQEEVATPEERHQVECQQLSGLIELVVLHLAQVQLLVDLVQQILLDDGVHHHGDEEIKEDSWNVPEASCVEWQVLEHPRHGLHWGGGVVLHHDEDRGQAGGHLEHEAHHEHHGHAGHDVSMVLDDKLVTKEGWVLGLLLHDVGGCSCLRVSVSLAPGSRHFVSQLRADH